MNTLHPQPKASGGDGKLSAVSTLFIMTNWAQKQESQTFKSQTMMKSIQTP